MTPGQCTFLRAMSRCWASGSYGRRNRPFGPVLLGDLQCDKKVPSRGRGLIEAGCGAPSISLARLAAPLCIHQHRLAWRPIVESCGTNWEKYHLNLPVSASRRWRFRSTDCPPCREVASNRRGIPGCPQKDEVLFGIEEPVPTSARRRFSMLSPGQVSRRLSRWE